MSQATGRNRHVPGRALMVIALAVLAAGGAAATLAHGSRAAADHPTAAGEIAFVGNSLSVVDADGSHQSSLAACPAGGNSCEITEFAWSPDGRRLAFLMGKVDPQKGDNMSLFVINANGSGEKRLPGCGKPRWPSCGDHYGSQLSWSPDGSRIVVTHTLGGSLYIVSVNGRGTEKITNCAPAPCFDVNPAWSPDESKIVFVRYGSLYSVNADGSGLARLTSTGRYGAAADPAWPPDGKRIAFDTSNKTTDRVYAIDANGSHPTLLASGPFGSGPGLPSWSPNGTQIAYFNTPGHPGHYLVEVWLVNANGTKRRRLYRSFCCGGPGDTPPTWSPDGNSIAFVSSSTSYWQSGLFLIGSDGRNLHTLYLGAGGATWQPTK